MSATPSLFSVLISLMSRLDGFLTSLCDAEARHVFFLVLDTGGNGEE